MKHWQWILGAALAASCAGAQAQWEWRDANGARHLSDLPPPPSVPPSRILKAPRGQMPDLRKELAEQPAPAAPKAKAGPTVAERNADFNKSRADAAEQAGKAAAEARSQAAGAAACADARANLRILESGMRVATAGADGQPSFLDEAQKAEQVRRNHDALAHCK